MTMPLERPRALILEDELELSDLLIELLSQDFKPVHAASLAEARRVNPVPPVVLADLRLRDGLSLGLLKEWSTLPRPPKVVMMTANPEAIRPVDRVLFNISHVHDKPCSLETVKQSLLSHIQTPRPRLHERVRIELPLQWASPDSTGSTGFGSEGVTANVSGRGLQIHTRGSTPSVGARFVLSFENTVASVPKAIFQARCCWHQLESDFGAIFGAALEDVESWRLFLASIDPKAWRQKAPTG